jgi:hypothetical protein
MDRSAPDQLRVDELRPLCKVYSLSTHGEKAELIERLAHAMFTQDSQQDDGAGSGERRQSGGAAGTGAIDELEQMRRRVELLELRERERHLKDDCRTACGQGRMPGDAHQSADLAELLARLHPDRNAQSRVSHPGPLSIPDFVDRKSQTDKKQHLEAISTGQYVMANARIMQQMLKDGKLVKLSDEGELDCSEVESYLRFTVHIGELIDGEYDWRVVLNYDNDMRKQQFEQERAWDTADLGLIIKHMTAPKNLRRTGGRRQQQRGSSTASGQPICGLFNSVKGCTRSSCSYAHVCRVCEGSHPACQHQQGGAAKN